MTSFPIVCTSCGATGSVDRVTASLQCRCGSTELDLWDGDEKTASAITPQQAHHFNMGLGAADEDDEDSHAVEAAHNLGLLDGKQGRPQSVYATNPNWNPQHHIDAYLEGHAKGVGYSRQGSKTAAPVGPGTGWNQNQPDRLQGWDEYRGPAVTRNPLSDEQLTSTNGLCPACGGSGFDSRASGGGYDETTCRLCHGTGKYTPTTSQPDTETLDPHAGPASGGARWQTSKSAVVTMPDGTTFPVEVTVTAGRKSTDPLGSVEDYIKNGGGYSEHNSPIQDPSDLAKTHGDKPLLLDQASCPNCRHQPTQILKDKNDDGWWHCPNCGPLANVDKHPDVNPFDPGFAFQPDRSMKTKAGLLFNRDTTPTGKLFKMMATVQTNNPGMRNDEAFDLARRALLAFPESGE